jgi:cysteine-S-conjugate beta-lyase
MPYDFDTSIERRGTSSLKWDKYRDRDILPLWVADMDFAAPPAVIAALRRHVEHGVYGYTLPPEELVHAVTELLDRVHGWKVSPDWLVWLPGLVTGINVACRTAGGTGDEIMTTTPAYPPFLSAPAFSGQSLVTVPHVKEEERYAFDFAGIEHAVTSRTRMFLLCNPQNPTGRVFTGEELLRLAEICLSNGMILCSDEIHCGLVLDSDRPHLSLAALDEEIGRKTITLLAPSKTYNLPGLGCSFAVIPDRDLRRTFTRVMRGIVPHVNTFGYTAACAAYRDSEDWRLALIDYLRKNRDLVEEFIAGTSGLSMCHVEATYLAWIDARVLDRGNPAAFFEHAGVGLSDGADFGVPGFVRLNFGCPRSLLTEALDRMDRAMKQQEVP